MSWLAGEGGEGASADRSWTLRWTKQGEEDEMACGTLTFQLANSFHCQDECLWRREAENGNIKEEREVSIESSRSHIFPYTRSKCLSTEGHEEVKGSSIFQLQTA